MDFVVSADQNVKLNESEEKDKYLGLARELTVELESDCNWCSWYSRKRIGIGTRGLRNKNDE